jgi:hypothetical protein
VALALLGLLLTLALPYAIYAFGKKTTLPDTFLSRYGPFIAPIAFTLVVWLFISSISGGNFTEKSTVGTIIVVFLPFFLFLLFFAFVDICNWAIPISAIAAYLFFIACFAVGTWRGGRFRTKENKKALCVLTSILILACIAAIQSIIQYQSIPISNP